MIWLRLFFVFFKVGLFAFGGAYSFIPLLEEEIVERHRWMEREEFLEISGMTTIFPGAISVKYATYVGYKKGGIGGALAANMGNFLPPAILIMALVPLYLRYRDSSLLAGGLEMIRIAVFAMIVAAGFKLIGLERLATGGTAFFAVFFAGLFFFTSLHPAVIIIFAGFLGAFIL